MIGTESWLDSDVASSEVFPPDYVVYRKDRNSRGGGVFLLTHISLNSIPLNIDGLSCESVWCRVPTINGKFLTVGSFYRPPSSNADPILSLSNALSALSSEHVVLGGDFNLPEIRWSDCSPTTGNSSSVYSLSLDLIKDFGLMQYVTEPTRVTNDHANVLDLIFCNRPATVSDVNVVPGISDHLAVIANLNCPYECRPNTRARQVYMYSRGDYNSLNNDLIEFLPEFERTSVSCNVDSLWNLFKWKIRVLTDKYVPCKVVSAKRRKDKPWINRGLRCLINKKNRLFSQMKKKKAPELGEKLDALAAEVKRKLNEAKLTYLSSLDRKFQENPKEFWKFIKSNRKDDGGIPAISLDDGFVYDDQIKATAFNKYFKSVFAPLVVAGDDPNPTNGIKEAMNAIDFNPNGIAKLLSTIKTEKAPGPDELSNYVVKACSGVIATYLTVIFTKSLENGVVPEDWKMANVVPIHKTGPKDRLENYRPISLTSQCCKVMEHVIYTNLIGHLTKNNFFTPYQHGFRSGFSCVTQLLEFYHEIALSYDDAKQVDCIFLDFRKAFDVVPHTFVMQKLASLNIDTNLYRWIANYLSDRKQSVLINGVKSSNIDVTSGVPQGSVLGPLLFLIFINDITHSITSRIRLYADDCVVYREVNCRRDSTFLQEDISKIQNWCIKWNMSFNLGKCYHLRFTRKQNIYESTYFLDGQPLSVVREAKYLGIVFSDNLRWDRHVDFVAARASRMLCFLCRNFRKVPSKLKQTLYFTYVRPIIEYACELWDPYRLIHVNKLEKIQNRAARFVSNNYNFRESITNIKSFLGWKPLSLRRKNLRLKYLHKIYNRRTGIDKDNYLHEPFYISHRTDNTKKIRQYKCRTDVYSYSFFPRTIIQWNGLPSPLVEIPTSEQFFFMIEGSST